jgi:hypothetical protein
MAKATAETLVTVLIPDKDKIVLSPHNRAEVTIKGMAPSRRLGAETNLRSWRRWITAVDPMGQSGWAFSVLEIKPEAMAAPPIGSVIVACEVSWAKASWYAGQRLVPTAIEAALHELSADGLVTLTRSVRVHRARILISWLIINRPFVIQSNTALARGVAR